MENRPTLSKKLNREDFFEYYYLKEELVEFCRENKIPTTGSKLELIERISYFLETGKILKTKRKVRPIVNIGNIDEFSTIEDNFICSEKHRAFFKLKIGESFSFKVGFQNWLKENSGKTYRDAIDAYYKIIEENKSKKTIIDKQFEYNTYIRDFFERNPDKSLEQAIRCWKYKKSIKGHNQYEDLDLNILL